MTSAVAVTREQSFRDFDKALAEFGKTIPREQLNIVVRKMALFALRRIVQRTPVETGRARANWQVTIGSPADGVLGAFDKSGAAAVATGESVIAQIRGASYVPSVWISNNLTYIVTLEEGGYPNPSKKEQGASAADYAGASSGLARKSKKARARIARLRPRTKGGYSIQAPRGMVAVTVQELLAQFGGT